MPRKPTDFGSEIDAQIEARAARGESAETVAAALGMPSQLSTIRRRLAKLRSGASNAKVSSSRPRVEAAGSSNAPTNEPIAPEEVPDVVPDGTPDEQLDRWIKRLETGATKAETQGNLTALASIAAKVTALMALKHRSAPLPKPDPNENPDMKALAEQGEKRLLALVHDLFNPKAA